MDALKDAAKAILDERPSLFSKEEQLRLELLLWTKKMAEYKGWAKKHNNYFMEVVFDMVQVLDSKSNKGKRGECG